MSAIRLARGFTGRDVVVKFAGCYHGHVDSLLAAAGSGLATFARARHARRARPSSTALTLVLPYNDRAAVEAAFAEHGDRDRLPDHRGRARQHGRGPAGAGLQRVPRRDLRAARRAVRQRRGDDRLPGSAAAASGASTAPSRAGARPGHLRQGDGRRLPGRGVRRPRRRDGAARAGGAGLPGRHAVREPGRDHRRPGHAAAGHRRGLRPHRRRRRRRSRPRSPRRSPRPAYPHVVQSAGTMFSRVLQPSGPVRDFADASRQDTAAYAAFFHAMLDQGVYLPPSAYEAWFLSAAHDDRACRPCSTPCPPPPGGRRPASRGRPRMSQTTRHDRPPAAPRRGAQPGGHPLRPPRRLPPLRPRAGDGRAGRRPHRRPRHHPPAGLAARAGAGDRAAAGGRRAASRSSPTSG